jgi:hypothetical protein
VRRAVLVHQVEALEPKDPQTPAGEVEQRGASHPSEAEHDRVVRWQRSSSCEVRVDLTTFGQTARPRKTLTRVPRGLI